MKTYSTCTFLFVFILFSSTASLQQNIFILPPKVLVAQENHTVPVFVNKSPQVLHHLLVSYRLSNGKETWKQLHKIPLESQFVLFNLTAPIQLEHEKEDVVFIALLFKYVADCDAAMDEYCEEKKTILYEYTIDDVALLRGAAVQLALVELSKPIYKPEEFVQLRVLYVNGWNGKMGKERIEYIRLKSPDGKVRQQWTNVDWLEAFRGFSYSLGQDPEEGVWSVVIPSKEMNFTVMRYVLPKFSVSLEKPSNYFIGSKEMQFKVCAKYSTGRSMKATIRASVCRGYGQEIDKMNECKNVPEVIKLDGNQLCANVSLSQVGDFFNSYQDYFVNATVEEEGTGVQISESLSCDKLYKEEHKIEVEALSSVRKNLPFFYRVSVKYSNGKPKPQAKILCREMFAGQNVKMKEIRLDSRGIYYGQTNAIETRQSNQMETVKINCQEGSLPTSGGFVDSPMNKGFPLYDSLSDKNFMIYPTELQEQIVSYDQLCKEGKLPLRLLSNENWETNEIFIQLFSRGLPTDFIRFPATKWQEEKSYFIRQLTLTILPQYFHPLKVMVFLMDNNNRLQADILTVTLFRYCFESEKYAPVSFSWLPKGTFEVGPGIAVSAALHTNVENGEHKCSLRVSDVNLKHYGKFGNSELQDYLGAVETFDKTVREYFKDRKRKYQHPDPLLKIWPEKCEPDSYRWRDESSNDKDESFKNILQMMSQNGINLITNVQIAPDNKGCHYEEYGPITKCGLLRAGEDKTMLIDPPKKPIKKAPSPRIRSYFPENWIYKFYEERPEPQEHFISPDTITSWESNFYCLTSERGLLVSPSTQITTFSKFYIQTTLPYSIKRGETVRVPVKLFNYLPYKYEVELSATAANGTSLQSEDTINGCIDAYGQEVFYFKLHANDVGIGSLTVVAITKVSDLCPDYRGLEANEAVLHSDAVKVDVRVEPEGIPQLQGDADIVCVKSNENQKTVSMSLNLPQNVNVVPQSERGYVFWSGDIMGPALDNLDKLVRMPYGCGEQNMITMVPSLYVLDYLSSLATSTQNQEIISKAKVFVETGYRRELQFRHDDGSFSAFGKSDGRGSTWLTAFVLKSFIHAMRYLPTGTVDLGVIQQANEYLLSMQNNSNGCFNEFGIVIHRDMRGSAGESSIAMQAYILATLLEAQQSNITNMTPTRNVIDSIYNCIQKLQSQESLDSFFSLPMLSYAVSLDKQSQLDYFNSLNHLLMNQSQRSEDNQFVFWGKEKKGKGDVEMTGYALLALINTKFSLDHMNIARWLSQSRNPEGGWYSTQETVVGLHALAKEAQLLSQGNLNVTIDMKINTLNSPSLQTTTINSTNRIVVNQKAIGVPSVVEFHVSGEGCVLLQVNSMYNRDNNSFITNSRKTRNIQQSDKDEAQNEIFNLQVTPVDTKNKKQYKIQSCVTYNGNKTSNMALLRLSQPTGTRFLDVPTDGKNGIRRVEIDSGGKVDTLAPEINIYIDPMQPGQKMCVDVPMEIVEQVEDRKPSLARISDYYEPEISTEQLYILLTDSQSHKEVVLIDDKKLKIVNRKCIVGNSRISWQDLLEMIMRVCSPHYGLLYITSNDSLAQRRSKLLWNVHVIQTKPKFSLSLFKNKTFSVDSVQEFSCLQTSNNVSYVVIAPLSDIVKLSKSNAEDFRLSKYSVVLSPSVARRYLRPSLHRVCNKQNYLQATLQRLQGIVKESSSQSKKCPVCLSDLKGQNFQKEAVCKSLYHVQMEYSTSTKLWSASNGLLLENNTNCLCAPMNEGGQLKLEVFFPITRSSDITPWITKGSERKLSLDKNVIVASNDAWKDFCFG